MDLICDLIFSPIIWFLLADIFKVLPPKVRLLIGSFITAVVLGTISGLMIVSTQRYSFEEGLNQASVVIPVLIILIFLVTFFGMWYLQTQGEKHRIQDQFVIARDLIRGQHYEQAKAVLRTINHPKALQWEAKLRDMTQNEPDFLQQLQ